MSANSTRCQSCRGTREVTGMGGILKKCQACNATGWITPVVETSSPTKPIVAGMAAVATDEVVRAVKRSRKKAAKAIEPVTENMFPEGYTDTCTLAEVLGMPVVVDPMTEACLAEPTMTADAWAAKYPAIAQGTSIRDRHGIRIDYASQSKPAPRKVDLNAMQDSGVEKDPDYVMFKKKQEALEARNAD